MTFTFPVPTKTNTVIKAASESRVNVDVSAIDSELKLALDPGTYAYEMFIAVTADNNVPDLRVQVAAPAGSSTLAEMSREDNASNIGTITAVNTDILGIAQNGGTKTYKISGSVNIAAAGDFGLGWAQSTLDAAQNVTVLANSNLVVTLQ